MGCSWLRILGRVGCLAASERALAIVQQAGGVHGHPPPRLLGPALIRPMHRDPEYERIARAALGRLLVRDPGPVPQEPCQIEDRAVTGLGRLCLSAARAETIIELLIAAITVCAHGF